MTATNQKQTSPPQAPLIGITTTWTSREQRTYSLVGHYYAQSVAAAGGLPVLLPLFDDPERAVDYMVRLDGLVLSGGNENVDPWLYGEIPGPHLNGIMAERDAWETALIDAAWQADLAILGICRGIQILNVARGGLLHQSISHDIKGCLRHHPANTEMHNLCHPVSLAENSLLRKIHGQEEIRVNSFHDQAIKKPAPGFVVTARSSEGVIEAIEAKDRRFVLGVQWHPEALTSRYPGQLAIFRALVEAART